MASAEPLAAGHGSQAIWAGQQARTRLHQGVVKQEFGNLSNEGTTVLPVTQIRVVYHFITSMYLRDFDLWSEATLTVTAGGGECADGSHAAEG